MEPIRTVAVIGAGVMGAGIAAQAANGGARVLLLDIPAAAGADRSAMAKAAVARLLKSDPAPLMHRSAARLIEPGNTEDDLHRLAEADWIVEAIVERLDAKQQLYRRVDAVRRPGTPVSSNTSTIPLRLLTQGMPDAFARDFLVTHFFNPPRYMRLLEVVRGPHTDTAVAGRVEHFADHAMGKTVVPCHDSPGFIANRLGTYWLQVAVTEAAARGVTVEEADATIGRAAGIPKTGVFGLLDLVGLDLMPHVNASMAQTLPPGDAFHAANTELPLIARMIADGYTGRKGKGGFYRLKPGTRAKEAIDLVTGEYRPAAKVEVAARTLPQLLATKGRLGDYARAVLGRTLAYAATLVPEATDDIAAVDEAMRLGYAWRSGPFEMIDQVGAAALPANDAPLLALGKSFYRVADGRRQVLGTDGAYRDVVRPEGVLSLADIKRRSTPVLRNGSAALWDIGDDVACYEFTSKMNALDEGTLTLLRDTLVIVAKRFRALVIYTDGTNFSVGANLGVALFTANIAAWSEIERAISVGQDTLKAMKYAPFPVVAAPAGMALGGGCEILLHADAIQAHAETYAGLVETGVGLVPGWGGCKEMLRRAAADPALPRGPMPGPARVFQTVSTATVSKSAAEARDTLVLRPGDGITMNHDRLLADAKARALALADGYVPPEPPEFRLPGPSGALAMRLAADAFHRRGIATAHDVTVAGALAEVLSGGNADVVDVLSEQDVLDGERRAFMRLVRTPATLARIEHTLETGKPLRN